MAKRPTRKEEPVMDIKVLILKPRLRIDEAAVLLDVTPRTVINYLVDEKLHGIRGGGGQWRGCQAGRAG
jgi:hypothetical protein